MRNLLAVSLLALLLLPCALLAQGDEPVSGNTQVKATYNVTELGVVLA